MIFKLTLETEDCHVRIPAFLRAYNYLRIYPLSAKDMKQRPELASDFIRNDQKWRHVVKLPDEAFDENENIITVHPTNDEIEYVKTAIKDAFFRFTASEYERGSFSVDVVPYCDGHWDNGKAFYVFPTSYTDHPVLNF